MSDYHFIDTHAHLDGEEFKDDLPQVIARAQAVGVGAIFIPGVNAASVESVIRVCRDYPGYCYPMIGLQPEEVRADWSEVLKMMKDRLEANLHQIRNQLISLSVSVGLTSTGAANTRKNSWLLLRNR